MYHKVDSPTGDSRSLKMLVLLPLSDLAIGLGDKEIRFTEYFMTHAPTSAWSWLSSWRGGGCGHWRRGPTRGYKASAPVSGSILFRPDLRLDSVITETQFIYTISKKLVLSEPVLERMSIEPPLAP